MPKSYGWLIATLLVIVFELGFIAGVLLRIADVVGG